jgi:hypothetical protein
MPGVGRADTGVDARVHGLVEFDDEFVDFSEHGRTIDFSEHRRMVPL